MNKNLKILSTVAAVGILTTAGLMGSTSAAAGRSLGVYRKLSLANGKTVVPYVLESNLASVTSKEVADEFGIAISGNAKTGTTFTKGTEPHHIVVYGDVNKSGTLTVADVSALASGIANGTLEDVQKVAGDVTQNNSLTVADVTTLANAIVNNKKLNVSLTPEEEPEVKYAYTLNVNENNVVNNQTNGAVGTTKISVKSDKVFDEANKVLRLQLVDANGNAVTTVAKLNKDVDVTIDQHSNYAQVTGVDFSSITTDGKYTIELFEAKDETAAVKVYSKKVGEVKITLNTVVPDAAQVTTKRSGTYEAKLSLKAKGESDIVKMYYVVLPYTAGATDGAPDVENANKPTLFDNATKTLKKDASTVVATKSMTVSNNELSNVVVANDDVSLTTDKAAKIYYVLENSYGSISAVKSAVITSDANTVVAQTKLEAVEAPTLKVANQTITAANFSWDGTKTGNFVYTLYKNGKPVFEDTKNVAAAGAAGSKTTVDLASHMTGAGKYYLSVVVKGDETHEDSEPTKSAEVEVKALNAVTNVTFAAGENSTTKLSWTSEYAAEAVKGYEVQLYTLDSNGNYVAGDLIQTTAKELVFPLTGATVITNKNTGATTTKDIAIAADTVYKAEVVAVDLDGQLAEIPSEVATSNEFFNISSASINVTAVTEKSATITLDALVTVVGKTTTYDVEVYEVTGSNGDLEGKYKYLETKSNVTPVKNKVSGKYDILVNLSTPNKAYALKLIAKVENIKGESAYKTAITLNTMPTIENLTVSATAGKVGEKKIALLANGDLSIDGATIASADISKYPADLAKVVNMLNSNTALVNDDIITLNGDTLKVVLPNKASSAANAIRNFGALAAGMTLEIEGNGYSKTIQTTANSVSGGVITAVNQPAEIKLTGTNAIFNVAGVNADKVVLTNGIRLTGTANNVTVAAGATVNINNVNVTAKNEVTIKTVAANALTVTPNNGANELTFDNTTASNLTITFDGVTSFGSTQSGKITIKSKGGTVSVAGDNMSVASTLEVTAEGGTVDVSDPTLYGTKDVTVTSKKDASTTVVANVETVAPTSLRGKTVDMVTYDLEDTTQIGNLKTALSSTATGDALTELVAEVQAYVNLFNITDKGATLQISADGKTATITFGNNAVVEGLKISNVK